MDQIVVFILDSVSYALPLNAVERVIHAVEIQSLPKAPEIIPGIINVKGRIIPVVDLRKRFGLASREIDISDHLVLANTGKRVVALLVDSVSGIREISNTHLTDTRKDLPYAGYIQGVVKTGEGLILIYDLEKCLSLNEENALEKSLSKVKHEV